MLHFVFIAKTVIICNKTLYQSTTLPFLWWHYSHVRCQSPCFTSSSKIDYSVLRPLHCFFPSSCSMVLTLAGPYGCKQMSPMLQFFFKLAYQEKKKSCTNYCHTAVSVVLCLNFFIAQKR